MRAASFLLFLIVLVLSYAVDSSAQDTSVGNNNLPPYGSFHGSDFDIVTLDNGNLHISIPIVTVPQRGGKTISYRFVYDTPSYVLKDTTRPAPPPPPFNTYTVSPGDYRGWRLVSPYAWAVSTHQTKVLCNTQIVNGTVQYNYYYQELFYVIDPDGAKHPFPVTDFHTTDNCTPPVPVLTGPALDGSGMQLTVQGPYPSYVAQILLKDGTKLSSITTQGAAMEDANGNTSTRTADTLNRNLLVETSVGSTTYVTPLGKTVTFSQYSTYTIADSNGSSQIWRIDYAAIDSSHHFCGGLQHCGEFNGPMIVPSRLTMPTGRYFQFSWVNNSAGELQRIDLPTGGFISYVSTSRCRGRDDTISDCRMAVTSRTVSDGTSPATWAYNAFKITDPFGNDEVHFNTLICNSGISADTQITYWLGSSIAGAGGTPVRTILRTYACDSDPTDPAGAANLRVIREDTVLENGQTRSVETDYESFSYTSANPPNPRTGSRLNPTAIREYDYGPSSRGALLRTTAFSYLHTGNQAYLDRNIVDRAASKTIFGPTGNMAAQTQYEYDNYTGGITPSGAVQHDSSFGTSYVTRGNVTAIKRWRNTDGVWLTTRNQFDDAGNVVSTADPLGHTTQFDFTDSWGNATCAPASGSARAYLKSRTNALGQITRYTNNSCTGTVASTTDPNSLVTTFSNDLMNRLSTTNLPDGGQTTNCYTDMGGATCAQAPAPFNIVTTKKINTTTSVTTVALTDGLARAKQSQLTSDPQGTIYTDTAFDAFGRVASVSNPYRQGIDITSTPGTSSYTYDGLGRKTRETYPDGSFTQTAYCGASTLVTDAVGKWRRSRTDALGRLVEVDEPNAVGATVTATGCPGTGEPIWVTAYTYDTLGNMTQALQNGSRQRNFTYDSLSHLLTSTNPEVGTITYTYNSDDTLFTKKDARNITTTYTYDAIHRELTSSYSNGDPTITTTYDQPACLGLSSCQNIGQRTSMTDAAGSESWSYQVDAANHRSVHIDQRTTNSSPSNVTKTSTYYLDLAGNVTQAVYPTGRIVNYTYDAANRPSTSTDGSNGITYATDFQTAPAGCLTGKVCYTPQGTFYALSVGQTSTFTGLNLTHIYNSRLQPQEFKASSSGGNAIDISYSFVDPSTSKNAGHAYSITNNLDSTRSQTFAYDQLNRLTSALTTSTHASSPAHCWGETYQYDGVTNGAWGNLTQIVATTNSAYTGCTQESGFTKTTDGSNHLSGLSYDLSGNTQNDGVNSYTWDAESQLKVTAGSTYLYDGSGRRVAKANTAVPPVPYKLYWYGAGGEILAETSATGATTAEYVFFGGKRVAMLPASSTPIYYVEDLLGTSRVTTTNTGVVCYDADFYPFGGERTPYTNTCTQNNYKFEGKERDTETGNDDFGARHYSNRFGRWLSADWSSVPVPVPYANLTNPQTLNLYAMVADDPESFADLDGHYINPGTDIAGPGALPSLPNNPFEGCKPGMPVCDDQKKDPPPQNQPNNRTGYDTQDEAARAALNNSNGASIKNNKEYAGLIYKDKNDGKYHFTGPDGGGNGTTSNPHNAKAPRGSKVVGDYHTHADYSVMGADGQPVRTHNSHSDDYNSNHFSPGDKSGIKSDGTGKPQYRGYLGTPSGRFLVYNPSTGQEGPLQ
jgi:RHS repeat-associated protein